jgi:hypothetical protein
MQTGIVERAYQLARTGSHDSLQSLKKALQKEGYNQIDAYFSGTGLRGELARLMRLARTTGES